MTDNSENLDKWRNFFQASKGDIFDIIENAITVAATDYPQSFRSKRDNIAEALFTCTLAKPVGFDHRVESSGGGSGEECKNGLKNEDSVFEKKVDEDINKVIINNGDDLVMVKGKQYNNQLSAETLSDELEEEYITIAEVLRIKKILQNSKEESEAALFDSLRLLQLMDLSVDKLDATKIGKTVNHLRKHRSKNISQLSTNLFRSWKSMVNDQWLSTKQAIAVAAEEDQGIPLPPLDEGAFFINNQPADLDLSKFFNDIDDDENPRHSHEELNKNLEIDVSTKKKRIDDQKRPEPKRRKQAGNGTTRSWEWVDPNTPQSLIKSNEVTPSNPRASMDLARKLEATKRKLHENYQRSHDAKKRRAIQVMELCDIPKQGVRKSGHANQNRHVFRR